MHHKILAHQTGSLWQRGVALRLSTARSVARMLRAAANKLDPRIEKPYSPRPCPAPSAHYGFGEPDLPLQASKFLAMREPRYRF